MPYRFQKLSLSLYLLVVLLIKTTNQVNIILLSPGLFGDIYSNTCTNIAPGICCLPFTDTGAQFIRFDHLLVGDIAAVWGPLSVSLSGDTTQAACREQMKESTTGPGTWIWDMEGLRRGEYHGPDKEATGASYITVPKALPPDEKTSAWLTAEGMLQLVWGGGRWGGIEKSMFHGVSPKSRLRRDIRSARQGQLWARSPLRAVYADVVEFRGEVYTGDGTKNSVFTDKRGMKVNMTELLGM